MEDAPEGLHPARAGAPWFQEEVEELVAYILDGAEWDEIAEKLQRTTQAVRAQASKLVRGEGVPTSLPKRLVWLRNELAHRSRRYDWLGAWVASNSSNILRTRAARQQLHEAWQTRRPTLDDLAEQFNVSVQTVVQAFKQMDLAQDVVEVADQVGCTPGGRAQRLRDRALHPDAFVVYMLVGHSAEGLVHVSAHRDRAAAERAQHQVEQLENERNSSPDRDMKWEVIPRGLGVF